MENQSIVIMDVLSQEQLTEERGWGLSCLNPVPGGRKGRIVQKSLRLGDRKVES